MKKTQFHKPLRVVLAVLFCITIMAGVLTVRPAVARAADAYGGTVDANGRLTFEPTAGNLPDWAYAGRTDIRHVVFNNTMTSTGNGTFLGCYNLESVTFGSNINTIGHLAFACGEVGEYNPWGIPNYYLTTLNIPSTVTDIWAGAFMGLSELRAIDIPASVTSLGESAFRNCTSATSITIRGNITSGEGGLWNPGDTGAWFNGCSSATVANIQSQTRLPNNMFIYCGALTTVNFAPAVSSVGQNAFLGCTKLNRIYLPNAGNWYLPCYFTGHTKWVLIENNAYIVNEPGDGQAYIPAAGTWLSDSVPLPVSKAATTGGSFTTSSSAGFHKPVTVTAYPSPGYEVDYVTAWPAPPEAATTVTPNSVYTYRQPSTDGSTAYVVFKKSQYTVSKAATSGGSFTVDKSTASYGDTVTVSTTPNVGYKVKSVSTSPSATVSTSAANSKYTFSMPNANTTVTVVYEKVSYTVSKGAASGGSFTVDKTSATYGDTITVNTTPSTGYRVKSVSTSPSATVTTATAGSKYTFPMPAANTTVTVEFEKIAYTVSKGAASGGSFTVPATATMGDTVTVNTTPSTGYRVKSVSTSPSATVTTATAGSKYTFTMPASNITVNVAFEKIPYTVGKGVTVNGSLAADKTTAVMGDTVTVTTSPDAGYKVKSVSTSPSASVSTVTADSKYTFTMPAANITVNAAFEARTYSITKNAAVHGSFEVAASAVYNTPVTVDVTPDVGYCVKQVATSPEAIVSTVASDTRYSFNMPAGDTAVTVEFMQIPYGLEKAPTEHGSFDFDVDGAEVPNIVTVYTVPDTGYRVQSVTAQPEATVATVAPDAEYTFEKPLADTVVSVVFEAIDYGIAKADTANGSFSVPETAHYDDTVTVAVSPDAGYRVKAVSVVPEADITVAAADAEYTFAMPAEGVKVTVEFEKIVYGVSTAGAAGGTYGVNADTATIGDVVTVTVSPDEGYRVKTVSVSPGADVTEVEADKEYTFVMPASDAAVTVGFEKIVYGVSGGSASGGTYEVRAGSAVIGDVITVTTSPDEGYKVKAVSVDPDTAVTEVTPDEEYTFVMPAADVAVTVEFEKIVYRVSTGSAKGGAYGVSAEAATIGDVVTVTTAPDVGYQVTGLHTVPGREITAIAADTQYSFVMPAADVTVSATFGLIPFGITKAPAENGSFTVSSDIATMGNDISVRTLPNPGYKVKSVSVSPELDVSTVEPGAEYSFEMPPGNATVTVEFERGAYAVNKTDTVNGTFGAPLSAVYGDPVTIDVTPEPGWSVKQISIVPDVQVETVTSDAEYRFTMPPEDVTVAVEFGKIPYGITKNPASHGDYTVSADTSGVHDVVTIHTQPDVGYKVKGVSTDPQLGITDEGEGIYSFEMPAGGVSVTVEFEKILFDIIVDDTMQYGTLKPSVSVAGMDDTVTITVLPDGGYKLNDVSLLANGGDVPIAFEEDAGFTFVMPPEPVFLTATFEIVPFHCFALPSGGGNIVLASEIAAPGNIVSFRIQAEDGFRVVDGSVKVNDGEIELLDGATAEQVTGGTGNVALSMAESGAMAGDNADMFLNDAPIGQPGNDDTASSGDELYSFVMPDSDVYVSAEFAPVRAEVSAAAVSAEPRQPPQTGDETDMLPYIVMLLESIAIIVAMLLRRYRKRKTEEQESKN